MAPTAPTKKSYLWLAPLITAVLTVASAVFHKDFGAYSTVVLGLVTGLVAVATVLAHAHLRAPTSWSAAGDDLHKLTTLLPEVVSAIEAALGAIHPVKSRVAGKLGRLPVLAPALRLPIRWVHEYGALPVPTYPIDTSGGITDWGMLGNDHMGDCGEAGQLHYRMAGAAHAGVPVPAFTTEQAVTEYLTYTDGIDSGVCLGQFLLWLYQRGEIRGFAPVDISDRGAADAALAAFGALYCGVHLTPADQSLFQDHAPWTGESPDPSMGHCIVQVGATGTVDSYVTWGAVQEASTGWTAACREEAWVVLTAEEQMAPEAYAALKADLDALPGAVG